MNEDNNVQSDIQNVEQNIVSENNLTSFPSEQSTSSDSTNDIKNNVVDNLTKKDIVTRPLLWGLVVFMVFFALVIGIVSIYRMYQGTNDIIDNTSNVSSPVINNPESSILDRTPVNSDTNIQANVIETELNTIDTDIEEDIYSDSSLGL